MAVCVVIVTCFCTCLRSGSCLLSLRERCIGSLCLTVFVVSATYRPSRCCLGGSTATLVPSSSSTSRRRGHGNSQHTFFQVCSGGDALRRRLVRRPVTVAAATQAHVAGCVAMAVCVCSTCWLVCAWGAVLSPLLTNHTRLAAVVRCGVTVVCVRGDGSAALAGRTPTCVNQVSAADCWCGTAFLSCSSRPAPWASMCGEFAVGLVFASVVAVHYFARFLPL